MRKHDSAVGHASWLETHRPRVRLLRHGAIRERLALRLGTIAPAMEIQELQDEELMAQAREWRLRALRGEKEARSMAHELEREVRRRFGNPQAETQHSLKEVRVLGELP